MPFPNIADVSGRRARLRPCSSRPHGKEPLVGLSNTLIALGQRYGGLSFVGRSFGGSLPLSLGSAAKSLDLVVVTPRLLPQLPC